MCWSPNLNDGIWRWGPLKGDKDEMRLWGWGLHNEMKVPLQEEKPNNLLSVFSPHHVRTQGKGKWGVFTRNQPHYILILNFSALRTISVAWAIRSMVSCYGSLSGWRHIGKEWGAWCFCQKQPRKGSHGAMNPPQLWRKLSSMWQVWKIEISKAWVRTAVNV